MLKGKHRLVVEITPEQRFQLNRYLAYGEQRRIFAAMLNDIVVMLDEFGHDFVTFMLEREFTYRSHMEAFCADRRSSYPSPEQLVLPGTARFDSANETQEATEARESD